jgi:peptidoglycan/LPS O-acetylase OafA/YrhL
VRCSSSWGAAGRAGDSSPTVTGRGGERYAKDEFELWTSRIPHGARTDATAVIGALVTSLELPDTTVAVGPNAGLGWSPDIEALRGVAIALVVLFHVQGVVTGYSPFVQRAATLPGAFILGGHTGVTLFFVLSGFLLAPPFLVEAMGGPVVARRTYFERRVRRIVPLYYLFVVIASVATAGLTWQVLCGIPFLFFVNSVVKPVPDLFPWSGVWWSLATEAQFYLLLPLLASVARRSSGRRVLAVLLALYVAAYVAAVAGWVEHGTQASRILLFASVFGRGPAFMLGALAAMLAPALRAATNSRSGRVRMAPDVVLMFVALGLGLLLQKVTAVSYIVAELHRQWWHIPEALLWSSVVLLFIAWPVRARRWLCNRGMRALGRWSYSLYLIHFPVLWFAFQTPGTPLRCGGLMEDLIAAGILAACVAASAFSYRFLERPFFTASEVRKRNGIEGRAWIGS